jgi:hypothetical protein
MMVLVLSVVVVSVLLLHVELLELVPGNHLVSLVIGGLEGGEGGASGVLAFHVMLLSHSSLNIHLGDLVGDLVLDTGDGGQRVLCVQLSLVGFLNLVVLYNLLVNFVKLPELLVLPHLHHGLVKLQFNGLHLVKGVVAGSGRSLWALGYTIVFPEWLCR